MYYSYDLGKQVIECIFIGYSQSDVSKIFNISKKTENNLVRLLKTEGDFGIKKKNPYKARKLPRDEVIKLVNDRPDAYCKRLQRISNLVISAVFKKLKKLGINYKKTLLYKERNEKQRQGYLAEISELDQSENVYVDESGIDEDLIREHARAFRGQKIHGEVSGKRFVRQSIIAAQNQGNTLAECGYSGICDSILFNIWLEKGLLPVLKPGNVLIMDNASFHKSEKTRKLIENAGCRLIFLLHYSPDLNHIEHFWNQLKNNVKNIIHNFKTLHLAIQCSVNLK